MKPVTLYGTGVCPYCDMAERLQVRYDEIAIEPAMDTFAGLLAPLRDVTGDMDWDNQRPKRQWWMQLRPVFDQLSRRPGQE